MSTTIENIRIENGRIILSPEGHGPYARAVRAGMLAMVDSLTPTAPYIAQILTDLTLRALEEVCEEVIAEIKDVGPMASRDS